MRIKGDNAVSVKGECLINISYFIIYLVLKMPCFHLLAFLAGM